MLRGNHDYNTSMVYGFYDECLRKYGDSNKHIVWLSFINVFNYMPLVALVGERVLAMHGGISSYINRLDSLDQIKRPTMIPLWGLTCNLVWSDPGAGRAVWSTNMRSVSSSYDDSMIKQFCNKRKINLIVQGHQIHDTWSDRGYNMTKNCKLVTIFSAPNYLGGGDTAAVLNISKEDGMQIRTASTEKGQMNKGEAEKT